MQALRCKAKNNRVEHKSCFKCAVSVPLLKSQFKQISGFIPTIIQQPPYQQQMAPPATELLLLLLLGYPRAVQAVLLLLALSIPSQGQGLESEQSWELPRCCEGTINYKKHQGVTVDLRIGCLGKYTLSMRDSETDPAPLKLEKASKNQSPRPTLRRFNKNVYIEKG